MHPAARNCFALPPPLYRPPSVPPAGAPASGGFTKLRVLGCAQKRGHIGCTTRHTYRVPGAVSNFMHLYGFRRAPKPIFGKRKPHGVLTSYSRIRSILQDQQCSMPACRHAPCQHSGIEAWLSGTAEACRDRALPSSRHAAVEARRPTGIPA